MSHTLNRANRYHDLAEHEAATSHQLASQYNPAFALIKNGCFVSGGELTADKACVLRTGLRQLANLDSPVQKTAHRRVSAPSLTLSVSLPIWNAPGV